MQTESVNEDESKEIKNVDEFQEYILQQKPANTKVKHKVIGRREMLCKTPRSNVLRMCKRAGPTLKRYPVC